MAFEEDIKKLQENQTLGTSGQIARTPTGFVNVITGEMLTPISSPTFATPTPTPISSVSDVDTTISTPTLSSQEQKISDLIKRITDVQEKTLGKTIFQTEQEKALGIPTLLETQKSLSKQILGLQAEAKSIPDIMQQQAIGRGITAGGLGPLTTAALRENSIKANILGAQLAASQLDLASAQNQIDRAVAMKFGPQEEELKAKLVNLELLLKDPAITLAEKNRANAQTLLLKKQEIATAQKKQEQTDIWKVSVDASANISNFKPTAQYPVANVALQAIQNSGTKERALFIATETGLTKPPTALSDFEQAFLREKGRLPTVVELLEFKKLSGEAGRKPEKIEPERSVIFDQARQFITDNPSASRAELKAGLLENAPNLNVTEINSLLDEVGIKEESIQFTDDQMKTIVSALMKTNTKLFRGGEYERTRQQIEAGVLEVNGKKIELSTRQKNDLITILDQEFPQKKRPIISRILPFGK